MKPTGIQCPYCAVQFVTPWDMADHMKAVHPGEKFVTAPVTGRKAVMLRAIDMAKRLRALSHDKLRLLDELIDTLNRDLRQEFKHDEERLHRLEQDVQGLKDAARGGRSIMPDGTLGPLPESG